MAIGGRLTRRAARVAGSVRLALWPPEWVAGVRLMGDLLNGGLVVPDAPSGGAADNGDPMIWSVIQLDGDIITKVPEAWVTGASLAAADLRARLKAHEQDVAAAFRRIAALGTQILAIRTVLLGGAVTLAGVVQVVSDADWWRAALWSLAPTLVLAAAGLFARQLLAAVLRRRLAALRQEIAAASTGPAARPALDRLPG